MKACSWRRKERGYNELPEEGVRGLNEKYKESSFNPPFLHIIHAPCREKAFNTMKRQKKTKYCKDLHRNGILPILVASCSNTRFSALRWMWKARKNPTCIKYKSKRYVVPVKKNNFQSLSVSKVRFHPLLSKHCNFQKNFTFQAAQVCGKDTTIFF